VVEAFCWFALAFMYEVTLFARLFRIVSSAFWMSMLSLTLDERDASCLPWRSISAWKAAMASVAFAALPIRKPEMSLAVTPGLDASLENSCMRCAFQASIRMSKSVLLAVARLVRAAPDCAPAWA
jgi:hypothetical protein